MLPYINLPFEYLSSAIGASSDELKLIFSFVLSYPFAGLLKRIPDSKPAYKNYFIIGVSLFYLVGLFSLWDGIRTLFISAAGTYALASYVDSPYMPWIGFVFLMGHLSINQIDRQIRGEPGVVDITGAQMVMVMKLTGFLWNVQDGKQPPSELSDFQKERALKKLPSIGDYAAWVLFFPSLFGGPAFDYVDYQKWITCTMFEVPAGVDEKLKPRTKKNRKIPRSATPAMWKAGAGVVWIFLFLKFSSFVYPEVFTGPRFLEFSFLKRVWFVYLLGFTARLKYYGVWSLTEGACILTGLGYNGVDAKTGRVSWDRLQNVNPWGLESAQNSRAYLANWNMNTNNWLRNYIYLRVTPKGKKPGFRASMATFTTSAFWHGFYPGYYLTFMTASLLQTVAKNCRRYFRPFFLNPATGEPTPNKKYYDIASWFITQFSLCYITAPFVILSFHGSLLVWTRVYFYGLIGILGMTILFASPVKTNLKKRIELRAKAAGVEPTKKEVKKVDKKEEARSAAAGLGEAEMDGANERGFAGMEERMDEREETMGPMGLPNDPEGDFEEIVKEVREEIEMRQRRGVGRTKTAPVLRSPGI